jgi:hypothetical protein
VRDQKVGCAMSRHPSLFQSLLEESSLDDDDRFILSAVEIVRSHSQPAKKHGGSVSAHTALYQDREWGT